MHTFSGGFERKVPSRTSPRIFSKETLEAIGDLGNALAAVQRRLLSEGYVLEGNQYVKRNK